MTDTCGPTFYAPLGKWDRESQSWKTSEATSLWALTLSSLTLPTWGGLHDGELCERPTPELATNVLDSSSLPTPTRADYRSVNSNPGVRGQSGVMPASEHSLPAKIHQMLPTPATEHSSGGYNPAWGHGMTLLDAAKVIVGAPPGPATLLPTPAVNDMGRGKTVEDWDAWTTKMQAAHGNGNGHGKSLEIEAQRLLPTPRAQEPGATTQGYGKTVLEAVTGRPQIGATTAPPSPDGNTSSGDPHQHQLSLDVQGIPA